jgi:lantibiotic biosynthesis protein
MRSNSVVAAGPLLQNTQPVLQGELRNAALRAAMHVAVRLREPGEAERAAALAAAQSEFPGLAHWSPPGVAQGNAGLALLWAYLDDCFPGQGWDGTGKTHLEIAARSAEQAPWHSIGIFSGLSGLAFAAWQLSRGGVRYRRLLASLDEVVALETIGMADRVSRSWGLSVGDFDAISGLSGIGAYLLCRSREPSVEVALANTVQALIFLVTRETPLPAWHTPADQLYDDVARETYPWGNLNCGLAHGVPGILAFLSLARLAGVHANRLEEAIRVVADWLTANRLDDQWGINWPAAVPLMQAHDETGGEILQPAELGSSPGGPSRAAWCYGSPGVARALWLAGRALGDTSYRDLALEAMRAVFRRPIPVRAIDSPTLCHGVSGLLAITLRFAADTGSPEFVQQCRNLAEQILDAFQPDSELGFRNIEYRNNRTDQPGLLDGAAGVAMVLLAASTGVEPSWDRLFLLS